MMPSFYEALVTNTIHQKALLCESGHDLLQTPPHSLHNYTGSCNVGSLIISHILMLELTPSFFYNIITVFLAQFITYNIFYGKVTLLPYTNPFLALRVLL